MKERRNDNAVTVLILTGDVPEALLLCIRMEVDRSVPDVLLLCIRIDVDRSV